MRIGLVLAAGGSVGVAYHGGVLAALNEATGWDPRSAEVIVGTSAGSITAAVLRAGVPAGDLAAISEGRPMSADGSALASIGRPHRPRPRPVDALAFRPVADWRALVAGLGRAAVAPWTLSPRALAMAALPAGGVPTTAISAGIDAVNEGQWPERPMWICAYDLRAGRRVVFGRPGSPPATVGQAVAASAAVPMYFRPVRIGGRRYVDGGVHSMTNMDLLAGGPDTGTPELDLVLVVSPLSQAPAWGRPDAGALIRQALRRRLRAEVAALRRKGLPVVAIQPGRSVTAAMGLNPMDAARRADVSLATRVGLSRWLTDNDEGRRLVELLSGGEGASAAAGAGAGAGFGGGRGVRRSATGRPQPSA